jgi:hypothetical protein
MKGAVQNGKLVFAKVPVNQPVQLVIVGMKNGSPVACIQPLQTGGTEISRLTFAATNPESFRKKISQLESVMN